MTLEFNGRSVTFTPNQRYLANPYGYFAVFSHNANGLQVSGFASGTYGSIQITESRTLSGAFYLNGVAAGASDEATPLYYLHTDQLATIHVITDKDQVIVWQGEHDAFGQTYATINQLDNPLRFPGQYFDAETGLHYNWHRYYNPATGRYVSSDPIGLAGGINTFGYALGNPVRLLDHTGLSWIDVVSDFFLGESDSNTDSGGQSADIVSNTASTTLGQGGTIVSTGTGALNGLSQALLGIRAAALHDYRNYMLDPNRGHINPRFEGINWEEYGDNFEEAYQNCPKEW